MSFASSSSSLSASFSSIAPLYDRSLLSAASPDVLSPPEHVFTLRSSSHLELPTALVSSSVRQGTKSSDSLNTNSVPISSDSPPLLKSLLPHHRAQLRSAWAISPRVPTVESRRVWAKARNLRPLAVHSWFGARKGRAKVHNQPIAEGTYELAVGNPNEGLDINEATCPDAFGLSSVADPGLSTPSLVSDSPISVTSSFFPMSSPPPPTVLAVSVKKPKCTKKVAPKRGAAAKAKPSATSLPAVRDPVRKVLRPHTRELQISFDPPFDPRLGFLFADGSCPIKMFPRFPSWQACPTLAGDVDLYLNLLPAPQSTSFIPLDSSQTEIENLEIS